MRRNHYRTQDRLVRGALRGLPAWALLLGVPLVVALGWPLPWFGGTLVAFLVMDAVLGVVARRRGRPLPVRSDVD
ncbi:hypothetical protein AB0873_15880 [Micromonospora sp. NPDC047707]|uniref:hypothetical protein n=1 Tax=Micromonospora sp. NPDC047707 TaxID=3154498 RepID=UPI003451277C